MNIIDLTAEHEQLYFCCLEDWSDEFNEAGNHKQQWYEYMKNKGLRVKIALDDNNAIGGMIQYVPIEHSMFEGENLYLVLCIWVHGHKQGRGNFQKKGMGNALLNAAEEDVKALGVNGIVTWGLIIPVFMRASWFKRHGYKVVGKNGLMRVMWKPFNDKAIPPKFIKPKQKPVKQKDKVEITAFVNGWCPAQNIAYERAKKASIEFGDRVVVNHYNTLDRAVVNEWGIFEGLYINGNEVRTGPPPKYEKLHKKLAKCVRCISK